MRTLLWITLTASLYAMPMTVDYTADGKTIMTDHYYEYEWEYEQEVGGKEVTVLLYNNGTPEVEDDIIVAVEELTDL